jgi:hypothetical protein
MNFEILSTQDLRNSMFENIDQSINEYIEIYEIDYLTNKDIKRIKQEIYKLLNNPDEYWPVILEIYHNTLELIFYNKLDIINNIEHQESLNEFIGEYNLIISVDKNQDILDNDPIKDNLDIQILGLYQNQEAGSINNIRIPFNNPVQIS